MGRRESGYAMIVPESQLQEQVAQYLRTQYPDVLFHSDFGSGVKLTPGQAMRQKRQNGGRRAWPDLMVMKKRTLYIPTKRGDGTKPAFYGALFIELKRENTRIAKKDGSWASDHIKEQAEVLEKLERAGYRAKFAVGFDEAKKIIDEYLGGK